MSELKKHQGDTPKKYVHQGDIPIAFLDRLDKIKLLSIDTETTGLQIQRDRLCVLQLMIDEQEAHVIHFPTADYEAPNLKNLLSQTHIEKRFHWALFDMEVIYVYLGVLVTNVTCTKILSRIARTYSDKHSLVELCREYLDINLNKSCQLSDWGQAELSPAQIEYAYKDVLYLPKIFARLKALAVREQKYKAAEAIFSILPHMVFVKVSGYDPCALLTF